MYTCRQETYTPQQISSHIVRHLLRHAEAAAGGPILDGVSTAAFAIRLHLTLLSLHQMQSTPLIVQLMLVLS